VCGPPTPRSKKIEIARVTPSAELAALLGDDDPPASLPAIPEPQQTAAISDELHAAEVALLEAWSALKPRQALFVKAYVCGTTGTAAAREAGYPATSSHTVAHRYLTTCEPVKRAIAAFREKARLEAEYDVQKAMRELDLGLRLAIENRQGMAYARCIEIRARLFGLLVDKVEATIDAGPNLGAALRLAQERVRRVRPVTVDGDFEELGGGTKLFAESFQLDEEQKT
jgi:hypothetical protein